jgi:uncharacterized 2Fe-2S/4Fe-4S cluster protein (DUF4445 family)
LEIKENKMNGITSEDLISLVKDDRELLRENLIAYAGGVEMYLIANKNRITESEKDLVDIIKASIGLNIYLLKEGK